MVNTQEANIDLSEEILRTIVHIGEPFSDRVAIYKRSATPPQETFVRHPKESTNIDFAPDYVVCYDAQETAEQAGLINDKLRNIARQYQVKIHCAHVGGQEILGDLGKIIKENHMVLMLYHKDFMDENNLEMKLMYQP